MSKRMTTLLATAMLCLIAAPAAQARDSVLHLPVKDVLDDPASQAKLGTAVAFYFGKQVAPALEKSFAEVYTTKRTNSFNKGDEAACRWAMLSALIQLVEAANRQGGDAVVNIRSDYKGVEFSSDAEYECHAGGVVAGVALKGKIVKLKK